MKKERRVVQLSINSVKNLGSPQPERIPPCLIQYLILWTDGSIFAIIDKVYKVPGLNEALQT